MALNGIEDILYLIDILHYIVTNDSWGIGKTN
jgi:hypothetical protein